MAILKGFGNKLTKKSTNRSIPIVSQPTTVVSALSLTAQADIDENTPENLYFHIFGAVPTIIKLFLYGEKFSPYIYTELPDHSHGPGSYQTGNVNSGSTTHSHTVTGSVSSTNLGSHNHRLNVENNPSDDSVTTDTGPHGFDNLNGLGEEWVESTGLGSHSHSDTLGTASSSINSHQHAVTAGASESVGVTPDVGSVRTSGGAKTFFDDLQIEINGVDQTAALQTQAGVAKFGDGTSGNIIVTAGIELDLAPFISIPGQHKIIFSLPGSDNGGKIRMNLYLLA